MLETRKKKQGKTAHTHIEQKEEKNTGTLLEDS
jgi:hypothetical protein